MRRPEGRVIVNVILPSSDEDEDNKSISFRVVLLLLIIGLVVLAGLLVEEDDGDVVMLDKGDGRPSNDPLRPGSRFFFSEEFPEFLFFMIGLYL